MSLETNCLERSRTKPNQESEGVDRCSVIYDGYNINMEEYLSGTKVQKILDFG